MNVYEMDILLYLYEHEGHSQREIAKALTYSLGLVNKSLKSLQKEAYIDTIYHITSKGKSFIEQRKPKNAIILAAGFGMRMVPINTQYPKGLLEVKNERLIERLIKQLHEVGIFDITIVVGFMKEMYEYLIDEYHVKLVVNDQYASKNNLYSLYKVKSFLKNTYILPCDVYCRVNPFRLYEAYSWYMVGHLFGDNSNVRMNRKKELICCSKKEDTRQMQGIAYLTQEISNHVIEKMEEMIKVPENEKAYWEEALFENQKMMVYGRKVSDHEVCEINTYEQLRELDEKSRQLKTAVLDIVCQALSVRSKDIHHIAVLKKGMTNRSFLFSVHDQAYIMRIPGEGTDQLINRRQEAEVYHVIQDKDICDEVIYMNSNNGYKITKYIPNARVCDPYDQEDLKKCMKRLKDFHQMHLQVNHTFDIWNKIEYYESLWQGKPSIYCDYQETKDKVFSLRSWLESLKKDWTLTHVDAVPDNFLFSYVDGQEDIRLIDWEYASMQDPHVDIAMFCIYAMYDKPQVDDLIDIYFDGRCDEETRTKIYAYIAMCGLLWSNWCEYKAQLGVEFGEYSIRQYRYAKEYYRYVKHNLSRRMNHV